MLAAGLKTARSGSDSQLWPVAYRRCPATHARRTQHACTRIVLSGTMFSGSVRGVCPLRRLEHGRTEPARVPQSGSVIVVVATDRTTQPRIDPISEVWGG
jgi:hypothetical protein